MFKPRRSKRKVTLQDGLSAWAREVREQAAQMKPGLERDALLRRARQADTASHLDEWINSSGLQSPK
jgi:hypothetical protein